MHLLVSDHPEWPYKGIHSGAYLDAKDQRLTYSTINESFKSVTSRRYFTYSEVCLLKAEAALRGWAGAGDAKTNYENGVRASFADWGAGGVDAYLADDTSKPINYVDPKEARNNFISRTDITAAWNESDQTNGNWKRLSRKNGSITLPIHSSHGQTTAGLVIQKYLSMPKMIVVPTGV
jgi:hypothetical protein